MKLKNPKVLSKLELEVEEPENTRPIVDGIELEDEDETVFYFSNASKWLLENYGIPMQEWSTQWNKVVYTFRPESRTRMAIRGESPENVQSIRKMFAERFAIEMFEKTKEYSKRNTPVEGQRPVPYNKTVLQPFIDSCLKPLPKAKLISKEVETDETNKFQGDTQPLGDTSAPYDVFKDKPVKVYGEMPSN